MMKKSTVACENNLKLIFGERKTAFFWTFTFVEVLDLKKAARQWGLLATWLRQFFRGTVYGVRVFELHEEHGLHIHAVINRRVAVELIRPTAKRFGFGRIHVKRVNLAGARYLLKYLGKQHRHPCLKGMRLWACFGMPREMTRSLVKNVTLHSGYTHEFWKARIQAGAESQKKFHAVAVRAHLSYNAAIRDETGMSGNPHLRNLEAGKRRVFESHSVGAVHDN